jgi:hypothetical protein
MFTVGYPRVSWKSSQLVAEQLAENAEPCSALTSLAWYDLELYNYGRIAYV